MTGIQRNIYQKAQYLLKNFPILVILGVRQAGKTTLAKSLCPDWRYVDLERATDFEEVNADPEFFFKRYSKHVIFDEAQFFPQLFNLLRSIIDEQRELKGRFIITGSSSPGLLKHVADSLAGRVALIELGTLKVNECENQPLSPFYELFTAPLQASQVVQGAPPLTRNKIQEIWLKGGYPEPYLQHDPIFYEQWMENYKNTYIHRDLARLFPRLNKQTYQRFLSMLGKLSGTIINRSDLARAIEVSEGTIREYLEIAHGTYVWRTIPSFERDIKKALVKMPKGHLRDTGLLHYILRITDLENLYHDQIVGRSFEAFVTEELIKGIEATLATHWQVSYYRTRNGAEIDLILEGRFGLLPIEIKYGSTVFLRQLKTLNDFVEEHQLPFGMIINQASEARWLSEKIVQVPVGWL